MSFNEIDLLKKRAESFLKNAEYLINTMEYDLAIFNIEQYCQLILKYKLLMETGSYPRTYSLRRLIRELGKIHPEILELLEKEDYLHKIARLEEAYISSRYLPITYEEKDVKSLYKFVVEVFKKMIQSG
ncbi:MAG: HEPN domain-containing protein [Candidatus Methanomethylicia archaeon]